MKSRERAVYLTPEEVELLGRVLLGWVAEAERESDVRHSADILAKLPKIRRKEAE